MVTRIYTKKDRFEIDLACIFLKDIELYFNHKARECLDGRTAFEVMMENECGMIVESLEVNFPEVRIEG